MEEQNTEYEYEQAQDYYSQTEAPPETRTETVLPEATEPPEPATPEYRTETVPSDEYKHREIFFMDMVQAKETEWLWYPYIPYGKITIIQGDPGEGKTTLALNIAAKLTRGELPHEGCEPRRVMFQTAEDGVADTVKPRLEAAGADCSKIWSFNESLVEISMNDASLGSKLKITRTKLAIFDPIQAYLGADVDMHRANEIRPVMLRLAEAAEQSGCAIVLIGHMNKASGMKAAYRGLGSIDLTAAARSVLTVVRDRKDKDRRIMMQIKNSLAREGSPLAFRFDGKGGFLCEGECDADVDEMLMGVGEVRPKQSDMARKFLLAELKDGKVMPAKDLIEQAKKIGVNYGMLKREKEKLGIISFKIDNVWHWKESI